MNAYVQKKWDSMAAELGGKNEEERMLKVLTLLMPVPARILCEKIPLEAGERRWRSQIKIIAVFRGGCGRGKPDLCG